VTWLTAATLLWPALLIGYAAWRQAKPRAVRPWSLLLLPAFVLLVAAVWLRRDRPYDLAELALLAASLGAGAALGRWQILLTGFYRQERSGAVICRGSPLSAAIWSAGFLLPWIARSTLGGGTALAALSGRAMATPQSVGGLGLLSAALLVFTVGLIVSRNAMAYVRYRELRTAPATA